MKMLDLLDIRVRLDEIKLLKAGWLDGKGIAPAHDGLDWLASSFDSHYRDDVPLPYLFPTPEGHMRAEWSLKNWMPSLEIDLSRKRGVWHALNLDTEEEQTRELDLTQRADWAWVANELRTKSGDAE